MGNLGGVGIRGSINNIELEKGTVKTAELDVTS